MYIIALHYIALHCIVYEEHVVDVAIQRLTMYLPTYHQYIYQTMMANKEILDWDIGYAFTTSNCIANDVESAQQEHERT